MKKSIIIAALMIITGIAAQSQNINWRSFAENQNKIASVNFGLDFGVVTDLGMAYKVDQLDNLIINGHYSFPAGKQLLDDYTVTIGVQKEMVSFKSLVLAAGINGAFRSAESVFVQMAAFGMDAMLTAGIYRPKWHLALEAGYRTDFGVKMTNLDYLEENYPGIQNTWYRSPGGVLNLGGQVGKTIGKSMEIDLQLGIVRSPGCQSNPKMPYYAQVGLSRSF